MKIVAAGFAFAVTLTLLSGCNATMGNRVACTVAGERAFFISEYGPVGISAVIDDNDTRVICAKPTLATAPATATK